METLMLIGGIIIAIVVIVGLYYLIRILIGYIGFIIFYAIVGGAVGVLLGKLISPENILAWMVVAAGLGAIAGLIIAILYTNKIVKGPFLRKIFGRDQVGTKYRVYDQEKMQWVDVTKTGGDLTNEFYKGKDGTEYIN